MRQIVAGPHIGGHMASRFFKLMTSDAGIAFTGAVLVALVVVGLAGR